MSADVVSAAPDWHALLGPIPAEVRPRLSPVATPELVGSGGAAAIADWSNLTVELSTRSSGDDSTSDTSATDDNAAEKISMPDVQPPADDDMLLQHITWSDPTMTAATVFKVLEPHVAKVVKHTASSLLVVPHGCGAARAVMAVEVGDASSCTPTGLRVSCICCWSSDSLYEL